MGRARVNPGRIAIVWMRQLAAHSESFAIMVSSDHPSTRHAVLKTWMARTSRPMTSGEMVQP